VQGRETPHIFGAHWAFSGAPTLRAAGKITLQKEVLAATISLSGCKTLSGA
jgi:hypothetical protein